MTTLTGPGPHAALPRTAATDMVLLLADLQDAFADLPLTVPRLRLERSVAALMKLPAIFDMPMVITSVTDPDGVVPAPMPQVEEGRGDVDIIVRTASNGLDDPRVRHAIERTGRRTLLIADIATEIAVQSIGLTAVAEGFEVHVLVDACAGLGDRSEAAAYARMVQAGVKLSSVPALIGELGSNAPEDVKRQANRILRALILENAG